MANAEIITIGTEILLGELVDTNAQYVARQLREIGINVYRKTSVGDNTKRIAEIIRNAVERSEIIITTGGLGPTVDDPTRAAVALAFGVETVFVPDLWDQIINRYERFGRTPTENNRRQAYIPQGATGIENPVGTAPAFSYQAEGTCLYALPGVPHEMEYLMQHVVLPQLRRRYPEAGVLVTRILHTVGVGESQIDDQITELEQQSNPTVGLAAHSGQVDIRITAKAANEDQAREMIAGTEQRLRDLVGRWIFGADDQTLEKTALDDVRNAGQTLCVVESGLGGSLIQRLADDTQDSPLISAQMLAKSTTEGAFLKGAEAFHQTSKADICLAIRCIPGTEKQDIHIYLLTADQKQSYSQPFGGPPKLAPVWAVNHGLNVLRRYCLSEQAKDDS